MRSDFENWMKKHELKTQNTAYQYALSIDKISRHYSDNTGTNINLFNIKDIPKLEQICEAYSMHGRFSSFGENGNGTIRNAVATYVRYIKHSTSDELSDEGIVESIQEELSTEEDPLNFSYERDLQSALISEVRDLFPNYKIFGNGTEGIEYSIGGKRIDVLLEDMDESELLAIELKAGKADFKVFGQISMYLGLLSKKYPNRVIKGIVIAGSIDDSLKNACSITDKVEILTYRVKLELEKA